MKLEKSKWNGCPVRYTADVIADKWTMVILRDLMFRGKNSYSALLKSSEQISTNILANRLLRLEQNQLLEKIRDPDNKKQYIYKLTDKGLDLMPMMLTLFEWAFKYDEDTYVSQDLITRIKASPEKSIKAFKNGEVLILNKDEP